MSETTQELRPDYFKIIDQVSTKQTKKKKKEYRICAELEEIFERFPKLSKVKRTSKTYPECRKVIRGLTNGLLTEFEISLVDLIASNLEEFGIRKSQVLKFFQTKFTKEERFELYQRLEKLKSPYYVPNLTKNGLNLMTALWNFHSMGIKSWLTYVIFKPPVKRKDWTREEEKEREMASKQLKEAWENMNDVRLEKNLLWLHIHYKNDLIPECEKDNDLKKICNGGFFKFINRYILWLVEAYGDMVDKDDANINSGWLHKNSKPFARFMNEYKIYSEYLSETVR